MALGSSAPGTTRRPGPASLGALRSLPEFAVLLWRAAPVPLLSSAAARAGRALLPVLTLFVGKLIVDEVVALLRQPGHPATLPSPLLLLLGAEFALALLSDLLSRAVTLADSLLGDRVGDATSLRLMEHAATLDLRDFEDSEVQDQLDRARRQASGRTALTGTLLGTGQDALTLAGFAVGIAAYAPWLMVLLVLASVPSFWGETRFNRLVYEASLRRTADRRELDYLRQTGASGGTAKEVKLFGLHRFLIDRYRTVSLSMQAESAAFAWRRALSGAGFAALGTGCYYAAYAWLAWRTVSGTLTVGDLTFLSASFLRLRGLLANVLGGLSSLASQALYLQDLFSFLRLRPAIASGTRPFPAALQAGIAFEDVGFRYPGAHGWAMRHLSFTLPAGRVLALVGENGAGKTTLVKLLTRLYDPDEGRILIDNHDLREYDLSGLRAGIGVIFQDFVRYDLSAGDNIAVGRIAARDDRAAVTDAAARGRADAVIDRLPGGYDQMVGRRFRGGVELSGGEWQKVALARAYMRDASVLVLDEPTAALDARAEFEVFERFKALTRGRTAVLISHRFASVRMADLIVVVAGGRVESIGTHEELLAENGRYAELFELQAAGYR